MDLPESAQAISPVGSDSSLPGLATPAASISGDVGGDTESSDPAARTRAPAPLHAEVDRCETADETELPDLLVCEPQPYPRIVPSPTLEP